MAVCLSSTKHQTLMIFFFLVSLSTPFSVTSDLTGLGCLKVSPIEFVTSLKKVSGVLKDATTTLQFATLELNNLNGLQDIGVSRAMSTCLDRLDMSDEEITWSTSAIQDPQGKQHGTGNLGSDLRTWLSATLANTDTCMDEFENTNSNMKSLISTKIDKVNMLVHGLLNLVHTVTTHFTNQGQFPSWIDPRDKNLLQTNIGVRFDAVVAADGSGNYTKIMDAVNVAPEHSLRRFVIFIKRGVYYEYVEISKKKWNIVMIGEGMDATFISGNLSYSQNLSTFKTATFGVSGRGFLARDISFVNTAGPGHHQAVALRSDSDLSVIYKCGIFGYQDTLYAHTLRQFYKECKISGTVDFIFGYGTAVFQKCQILVRKGLPGQKNTITAHGGKGPNEPPGFSFQFCNISADVDLLPLINSTYLGRPWKEYARTVFMQSYMSEVVGPEGWLEWNKTEHLDTLYYAEFNNTGPGAGVQSRVKWPRYHVLNDSSQATNFTVAQLILGDLWLPSTGVTFTSGFEDESIA